MVEPDAHLRRHITRLVKLLREPEYRELVRRISQVEGPALAAAEVAAEDEEATAQDLYIALDDLVNTVLIQSTEAEKETNGSKLKWTCQNSMNFLAEIEEEDQAVADAKEMDASSANVTPWGKIKKVRTDRDPFDNPERVPDNAELHDPELKQSFPGGEVDIQTLSADDVLDMYDRAKTETDPEKKAKLLAQAKSAASQLESSEAAKVVVSKLLE